MKKLLLLAIVVLGISAVSFGQNGNTLQVNSTASAKLLKVLTLTQNGTELSFGAMTIPEGQATVELSSGGARTLKSGSLMLLEINPLKSVPSYTVTGDYEANVQITLPSSDVEIKNGTKVLKVNTFTCSDADKHITLDDSGTATFTIGANLVLESTEASPLSAGRYQGEFEVKIAYE